MAARSATFGDAHLANGLLPAGGSTVRLPRSVGWHRAKWLILSAKSISAETARDWGLVLEVSDDGDLRATAERIAHSMIHGDAAITGKAKDLLANVSDQTFDASLDAEIAELQAHSKSEFFQSRVRRFLNRNANPSVP